MSRAAFVLALLAIFYVCVNSVNALECSGANEVFKECGTACEPTCKNPEPYCIQVCVEGVCQCARGFVRDSNHASVSTVFSTGKFLILHRSVSTNRWHSKTKDRSVLVALAKKLECNRPHEEYQCGSACQTTCATLGQTCPIVNIRCNDACYCVEGYARNSNGVCIPIKSCPPKRRNAKYNPKLLPFFADII
ncbi:von Willebrand factor-like [Xylocopa sonorina]|uniref:von Willebrand factor-like n=1 Tax=Xylocopa sonorina TaxID=1818115 RepID=UPI00403A90C4